MRQGSIRRAVAAASATAMAGAALVVGGAGVASAEPATASGQTDPVAGNYMSYERTISNSTPVYGGVVTISAKIQRHGWANTATLSSVRNLHPECFEYVPGSASWTASGKTYTEAEKPSEVDPASDYLELDPPGLWETTPFLMQADFTVLCDAGEQTRGGLTWRTPLAGQGSDSGSENSGPKVTVQRLGTSVFLAQPANPQVDQSIDLRVTTTNVPDGGQVAFTVDGHPVGVATVSDNQATLPWASTTDGNKKVQANFTQTGTHGGSVSIERSVIVSQANVNSTVNVVAAGDPKVGQSTQLTATVSPAGSGGTIEFLDNGSPIGSAPVGADGTASIDWIPGAAGERTIDANFSGRTAVNPSNGAAAVTVAEADVNDVVTTTTLDPIAITPVGQQITLKATVDAGGPGGTVNFYDGQALIGTADVQPDGTVTLSWTPTADGERTVRAVFSGRGVYLSSQGTQQAVITPAVVDPDPDPGPTDPATGSLGSVTDSLGGGAGGGTLSSLGS